MTIQLSALRDDGKEAQAKINCLPDKCPLCEHGVQPVFLAGRFGTRGGYLYLALVCPRILCGVVFTGIYRWDRDKNCYALKEAELFRPSSSNEWQDAIKELSPDYCDIFSQAALAEVNGLDLIAGPGYRKALEFLVKDYLIKHKYKEDEDLQEKIRVKSLGQCIDQNLDEANIKACAERAAWLGNDETHYYRKWDDKDINDLKTLIEMTQDWVDLTLKSAMYMSEMDKRASNG